MARKTTAEMIGESLREFGVLFGLFFPLEHTVVREERLTLSFLLIPVASTTVLIGLGVIIERRRKVVE